MTFHHKEQILNNKHHFLRNNWIASSLKNFSLQKEEWRRHDILSVSNRTPSHHGQCLAVSVLTAPLSCPPDLVFKSTIAVLTISENIRGEAPPTWPCCFVAHCTHIAATVEEFRCTHDGTLYKNSLTIAQRLAEKRTGTQTQFVIFQCQCGWQCWSLCVYEVNSRLKCQIYHFGSLNQKQRGAYFSLAKMKCLFTELFTFICSPVVSRINVSGVSELWNVSVVSVFTSISHNLCIWILGFKVATDSEDFNTLQNQSFWFNLSARNHFSFSVFLHHVSHSTWIRASAFCGLTLTLSFSCPVVVRLCRMVACAGSQGAEADVEGFTHLKALEGQPQDERWLLRGSGGGVGEFNPSIPPFLSSSALPSPPLTL